MPIPAKTQGWIQKSLPWFTWKRSSGHKTVYLTFDDGPIEGMTPWILDLLAEHKAKASFFVVGGNVVKNPALISRILDEGHTIGNHTFNHINGWKTPTKEYVDNIRRCAMALEKHLPPDYPRLFRPPYGKMTPFQVSEVRKAGYEIILWDILSKDYDSRISPERCRDLVIQYAEPGSIIVMHDNLKAEPNVYFALPQILNHFEKEGFAFLPLV